VRALNDEVPLPGEEGLPRLHPEGGLQGQLLVVVAATEIVRDGRPLVGLLDDANPVRLSEVDEEGRRPARRAQCRAEAARRRKPLATSAGEDKPEDARS